MSDRILVLGAAGRFGYAAAEAFRDAGRQVTGLVRPAATNRAPRGIKTVETTDRLVAIEAGRGKDVVLHALNPPFKTWRRMALPHAYSAIEVAETNGATLLFPGSLWNYGKAMPDVIDETTPMLPATKKGDIRVTIEERIREASDRGMRAIVLRAGDFFGAGRGSWLDLVIAKEATRGIVTYPGPLDVMHEWAYVPDLAATAVKLAKMRDKLGPFETFGFPGHAVTGRELVDSIGKALRQTPTVKRMQWWMIHALSPVMPLSRELSELAYLWKTPHRIAGDKLKAAIGTIPHTPLDRAIAQTLKDLKIA